LSIFCIVVVPGAGEGEAAWALPDVQATDPRIREIAVIKGKSILNISVLLLGHKSSGP